MTAHLRALGVGIVATISILAVAAFAVDVGDGPNISTTLASTPFLHPTVISRHPAPRVLSGASDHAGRPATIACSTCHALRTPNPANRATVDLDQFHQGLQIQHGMNSCLSCHDADNYDNLKLADGRKIAYEDSIELCSQCHGPQRRDYERGVHGGMNGYWDLTRGGRVRNTCIDCHDPHVPKFQGAIPMPAPRDRFQLPTADHIGAAHE
jgi:hypothetical protein